MFSGKTALITGASSGIGEQMARQLAAVGCNLILVARRTERLDSLAAELASVTVDVITADLSDPQAAEAVFAQTQAAGRQVDILINNAGMQHRRPLEDFPPDAFEKLLQTNIASVFNVGQACARHMIGRRAGKIVNICSVQTALARPGIAPYTATKGAVASLTRGMATDWGKYGLQINGLAPGYFATPLNQALVDDPDFTAWLENRTPAGRWGKVEELVGAAIFLSSQASSFVNGTTVYVDGGITACL